MIFRNRQQAGQRLAYELAEYAGAKDLIVLGIPRGGVPVAFEVARELGAPLDLFLSRKLGVPGQEELAFGAIAAGGGRFLDQEVIDAARISPGEIEQVTRATTRKLEDRARLYRNGRPPLSVEGRTVILVDDGIATGSSMYAAIRSLQGMKPKSLIVAVPVAPRATYNWLGRFADKAVVLYAPENFHAVGQFYAEFSQVSDNEVIDLLKKSDQSLAHQALPGDCSAA